MAKQKDEYAELKEQVISSFNYRNPWFELKIKDNLNCEVYLYIGPRPMCPIEFQGYQKRFILPTENHGRFFTLAVDALCDDIELYTGKRITNFTSALMRKLYGT